MRQVRNRVSAKPKILRMNGLRSISAMLMLLLVSELTLITPTYSRQSDRWWQRENPIPASNQIINPDYLKKKRELEIAWDAYQKSIEAEAYFRSLGQNTSVLRKAVRASKREVDELTQELSRIPAYIEVRRETSSGSDASCSTPNHVEYPESRITYTPPKVTAGRLSRRIAFADFSSLPDDFDSNCEELQGAGFDPNPYYKHSLRLLYTGSILKCKFDLDIVPSRAILIVEHLSSLAESCPQDGYSPVSISINETPVVVDHSPPSHGMITERWNVADLLKIGTNIIIWEAGELCSHYWIKRWEIVAELK